MYFNVVANQVSEGGSYRQVLGGKKQMKL